ncbi:MAG: metallopeptidase family protein [bacterium]
MFQVTQERFEKLVAQALDQLPDKYQKHLENVSVVIMDGPDHLAPRKHRSSRLLGRYHGVPRINRPGHDPVVPDQIILYRQEITSMVDSEEALIKQIKKTLWHEIGHYVGFSDPELRKLESRKI